MDNLLIILDNLSKHKSEDASHFYTNLSNYKFMESDDAIFFENLLPKIYYLYEQEILRKDLVYLSLLASQNNDVLKKFIEYDKSVYVFNIEDPVSLYDYYIYAKNHWLYEVINKPNSFDKVVASKEIYNKINMIKYIMTTNSLHEDIDSLQSSAMSVNSEFPDDFWQFYLQEVNRFIDIAKFSSTLIKTEYNKNELFLFASKHTLLDILSAYTDLRNATHWDEISEKLRNYTETEQLNIFTGFTIITTLVDLIIYNTYGTLLKKDFINTLLENLKDKLINLEDKQIQIELLENIFCLLFYRNGNEFTCKEKEIRFILFLIKTVIEELKLKKKYDKNSNEYKRLSDLNAYVMDALWRLDIILTVKNTPKVEDQLLNYMLSPPKSLIHLCMKKENFERAHQVIEVCMFIN